MVCSRKSDENGWWESDPACVQSPPRSSGNLGSSRAHGIHVCHDNICHQKKFTVLDPHQSTISDWIRHGVILAVRMGCLPKQTWRFGTELESVDCWNLKTAPSWGVSEEGWTPPNQLIIWWFPKIGLPPVIIHILDWDFPCQIKHPVIFW